MENLGKLIREKRQSLGLKVYELAQKVGVSAVYITQIEKHGKLPSPIVLKKIVAALGEKSLLYFSIYQKLKYPDLSIHLEKSLQIKEKVNLLLLSMAEHYGDFLTDIRTSEKTLPVKDRKKMQTQIKAMEKKLDSIIEDVSAKVSPSKAKELKKKYLADKS